SILVVVRATSVAQPALSGEALVRVLNPNSLGTPFAPSVSVRRGDTPGLHAARAPLVTVRRGVVISGPSIALAPLASVRRGVIISSAVPFLSPMLSVRFGFASG